MSFKQKQKKKPRPDRSSQRLEGVEGHIDSFPLSLSPNRKQLSRQTKLINPLNAELNPICHLLALLGAHHILHVSGLRVNTDQILKVKLSQCLTSDQWRRMAEINIHTFSLSALGVGLTISIRCRGVCDVLSSWATTSLSVGFCCMGVIGHAMSNMVWGRQENRCEIVLTQYFPRNAEVKSKKFRSRYATPEVFTGAWLKNPFVWDVIPRRWPIGSRRFERKDCP